MTTSGLSTMHPRLDVDSWRETEPTPGLTVTDRPTRVWHVRSSRPFEYEVRFVDHLLDSTNPVLSRAGVTGDEKRSRRFLVVDAVVDSLYGDKLRAYMDHYELECRIFVLPVSEERKTMDSVLAVVRALDEFGIARRHERLIAFGGGVLLDIVGLVAALYRRSTPYVRVPTTLLSLVDAGLGAKTGVNFDRHKNRLGSYFPPMLTLLDTGFLATLDRRNMSNGLAEVLKIALIKDQRLFELLEQFGSHLLNNRFQTIRQSGGQEEMDVLRRAIHGMLEELQPDLWEHTLERVMDYGHSFSPDLEMQASPRLLHGEAVAVDMALSTVLAWFRGLVTTSEKDRILDVVRSLELPLYHPLGTPAFLLHALKETVRQRDGLQRLPLPAGIGNAVFVNDVEDSELARAAGHVRHEALARG